MQVFDKEFVVQGIPLVAIARDYGTPTYVYNSDVIDTQISVFRRAFDGLDFRINYACKANSNLAIMQFMKSRGLCLDTVSPQEVLMGLNTGFLPGEIIFTPNCVDFSEIEDAVEKGVAINIENLSNLRKFGQRFGEAVPVCIRLNPHIATQMSSEQVDWWHKQSKFGISLHQLKEVKELEKEYNLRINGIHIHSSSVIMNPEVFIAGARAVFEVARKFDQLEFIDFGGGIKVDVSDGNKPIDLVELGKEFKPVFEEFCNSYGRKLQVWFEPGRFLVMNAGMLLTRCVIRKNNGDTQFVGVDSGFNHLIRPMMYNAYHKIVNISNTGGDIMSNTVVGNICEIDNFALDRELNEVREGDLIAIMSAGAYGYSMASNYNSRYRPAEVFVHQGRDHLIRKRDTFDDLVRNQVPLPVDAI